jgi:ParB/RepB/Spo0J family partition protein
MSYARKLDDVALLLDELEGLEAPASSGKPLEISLSSIEEDPNQPRRAFDANTLEELAASIRERGVLQPIGLTPAGPNGMHRIVFGARRFRAAQLAGRATIAAFIQSGEASDPYDQMIENIQRDDLSAADIAAFITSRLAAGEKQKDIALRLGKDKSYIAMYASVVQMTPMLGERLETSPIRAVYELHQMWKKSPQAVEALASVGKAIGARRSPMQSTVTVVRWTQRGSWLGVGRASRADQLRVFPLWTRPLLAGRSFFDFGVAGRFGPCVSASRFGHRRSCASPGNFTLSNLAIAWRSNTFPPRLICNDASRNFHCQSFGRCAAPARASTQ